MKLFIIKMKMLMRFILLEKANLALKLLFFFYYHLFFIDL